MLGSSVPAKPVCFDKQTKVIDDKGGIITIERWGIKMSIPQGAVRRPVEISIAALRNVPDLQMQENEVLISCGIQCNPSGLQFDSPVHIFIPHCVQFRKGATFRAVLYTTDSDEGKLFFKRIDSLFVNIRFTYL